MTAGSFRELVTVAEETVKDDALAAKQLAAHERLRQIKAMLLEHLDKEAWATLLDRAQAAAAEGDRAFETHPISLRPLQRRRAQTRRCQSASKSGSDSILMKLRRRCGLVSQGISAMQSFRASELLPPGFCAVEASSDVDSAVITIRAVSANSPCPSCGAVSDRVHSRYPRRLADLPIAGRRAVLMLEARRFRCEAVLCERRIFTERFDDNILKPWARRTARLDQIVHCLAIALGGRPAASFARRLSIPVSNDTLLRAVRRRGAPASRPPGDHRDRRLGLASQPSLWNADL